MSNKITTFKTYWYNKELNFGDALNEYLIPKLFNVNIKWSDFRKDAKYFAIGSNLRKAKSNSIIWGTGAIASHINISKNIKVSAVRGPLTRDLIIRSGNICPATYGDPCLLLPRVYSPSINKKYKIGIIPHYVDENTDFIKQIKAHRQDIKIIDIKTSNTEDFIDQVLECDVIMSSSLHGLITADAYSIPSVWIKLSNNIIGNDFKFYDYYKSIGRYKTGPIKPSIKLLESYKSESIFDIDLDLLYKSSPFLS